MKFGRLIFLIPVFFLVSSFSLFGAVCRDCGAEIPDENNFCGACGARQSVVAPVPMGTQRAPASMPPLRPGKELPEERFRALLRPFEAFEPELMISKLGSPSVRSIIQLKLVPLLEALGKKLSQKGIPLTRVQARTLNLMRERYLAILEGSTTLGSDRGIITEKISQLACLQEYLLAGQDEETLSSLSQVEAVYAKELQNLSAGMDILKQRSGFANPGVVYRLSRGGVKSADDQYPFTLLVEGGGKKIGNRMQLFDQSGKGICRLEFVGDEGGVRKYAGRIPRKSLGSAPLRQVVVEYAVRSKFSASWEKQKLRLLLVPCLFPGDPGAFELEAYHGMTAVYSRIRFLQSIGKY